MVARWSPGSRKASAGFCSIALKWEASGHDMETPQERNLAKTGTLGEGGTRVVILPA